MKSRIVVSAIALMLSGCATQPHFVTKTEYATQQTQLVELQKQQGEVRAAILVLNAWAKGMIEGKSAKQAFDALKLPEKKQ